MKKGFISPRLFIKKAMEIYSDKTPLAEILNGEDTFLRLRCASFGLKELTSSFGEVINTSIKDDSIYVYKSNVLLYIIEDCEFTDTTDVDNWTFSLFLHWGAILKGIEFIGQQELISNNIQTALVTTLNVNVG